MKLAEARHAFVTGGASGFGLAIADALAGRGVRVTIADANEEALAAVLAERRGAMRGVHLDVRDRDGWARAKAEAEADFGPVDLLFNNAGIAPDGRQLADMPPESFDRVVAINLTGVFNGVSTFAAGMREAGRGHIATTSSMSGMAAVFSGNGSYAASKFGVVALMEALRLEMAPHGVGVSVFCPGTTATYLMENTRRLGGELQSEDATLRGMPVKPQDVVPIILRGIEENRLYIFTHPERRAGVEERFAGIMAGFDAG
jgi:NAD(P)-dependent dehydrogenase (short-subunit alcohol dehydrogenase family)